VATDTATGWNPEQLSADQLSEIAAGRARPSAL
jgi:hypothetical protein